MKRKGMLKLIIPITLVVVLAIAMPMMSGCRPAVAPPEVAPPEVAPPEVAPPVEVAPLEPIKIGLPVSLTGGLAADGMDAMRAAIMAIEEINAAGGVLGRPLEAVIYDVKEFEPDIVRSSVEYLAAQGCDLCTCMYMGGMAHIHAYGKFDIPYMHCSTNDTACVMPVYENPIEYNNVHQTDPSSIDYGPSAAMVMIDVIPEIWGYEHPNKTVAVLTADDTYCQDISRTFKEELPERGWTVIHDTAHPLVTFEFGIELAAIRAEEPAIIFLSSYLPSVGAAFMTQFLADPIDALIYIQYGPSIPEFRELCGEKSNGVLWQTLIGWLPPPHGMGFSERFEARWGEIPAICAPANTYDHVYMWAHVVEKVGDPSDHAAVNAGIRALGLTEPAYTGISGTYRFDPVYPKTIRGELGEGIPNQFFQIQDELQVLIVLETALWGDFIVPPWFTD